MFRWIPFIAVVTFATVLFFPGLADRDLTSSHEARAAQNAQTILDEGHWLVPRLFDRHLELQKPPMYYWLVALLGWLAGGNVDAKVRLLAALSALVTALFLITSAFARHSRLLAAPSSRAACIYMVCCVGRIDMLMTMTSHALAPYISRMDVRHESIPVGAFGYVALAIGVLLSGPIAIVLPAVVAGRSGWRDRAFVAIITPGGVRLRWR